MKKFSSLKEDLRQWFDPDHPKGGWKRINSKGEAIGPCAREPGEAKPKCMSNEKRAKLSKQERVSAVRAKRKHDPNPERKGEPINVSNFGKGKISEDMENLEEKNVPTSPEKWAQAKAQAKAKFDVYPSAYANGWAAKKYKEMGGEWKSVNEDNVQYYTEQDDTQEKNEMALTQLHFIKYAAEEILEFIEDGGEIEEWYQNKLSKVHSDMESLHSYMEGESRRTGMKEEVSKTAPTMANAPKMVRDRKTGQMYDPNKKFKELMDNPETKATMHRLAKEEKTPNLPFDPPYSKAKETTVDKSGAKHGPMSIARHLAKQALKKQTDKYKQPVKEESMSSKAKVIKDIVKKKVVKDDDKFQSEPVISTQSKNQGNTDN